MILLLLKDVHTHINFNGMNLESLHLQVGCGSQVQGTLHSQLESQVHLRNNIIIIITMLVNFGGCVPNGHYKNIDRLIPHGIAYTSLYYLYYGYRKDQKHHPRYIHHLNCTLEVGI